MSKVVISVLVSKEFKEQFELLARYEERSISNMAAVVLKAWAGERLKNMKTHGRAKRDS